MTSHRFLDPWFPSPVLRTVRHQVNNLLAPVTVAAELLEDGSDVSNMLKKSADRLRRTSTRLALLTRPGDVHRCQTTVDSLLSGLGISSEIPATPIQCDPDRVRSRLLAELLANDADVAVFLDTVENVSAPDGRPLGHVLCLRSTLTDDQASASPLTEEELLRLPVPLTMRSGGLGLAVASFETHLQGGRVRLPDTIGAIDFLLPL